MPYLYLNIHDSQDNGMQVCPDLPKPKMSPMPAISRSRLDSSFSPTPATGFRWLAPGPGRLWRDYDVGSGDGFRVYMPDWFLVPR